MSVHGAYRPDALVSAGPAGWRDTPIRGEQPPGEKEEYPMGSRRRLWRVLALFAAIAIFAAACSDDSDDSASEDTTTTTAGDDTTDDTAPPPVGERCGTEDTDGLKVGAVLPATGDLTVLGPPMYEAVNMAICDVNAAGGVNGAPVQLIEQDSGTNEDVANTAVDELIGDDVSAIIGAASSRITLAIIDKITGAGIPECSPSNTGSALTEYPDDGFYFRTAPPDNLQGPTLADVVTEDGFANIGIIALNDEYGQGFVEFLVEQLENNGATIAANVPYDPAGTNFDADVQEVADAAPDAVVLIAFPDTGGQVLTSMIEQGIGPSDVQIYVADGMATDDLYELVDAEDPAVTSGIRGTSPSAAPADGAAFFPDAFAEYAPDVDTIFSAHAYDCGIITALAAAQAGSNEPADIQANMASVTKDGTECESYSDCLALIEGGQEIDYNGASGALDFVEAGEPGAGTYDVFTFQDDGSFAVDAQVGFALG